MSHHFRDTTPGSVNRKTFSLGLAILSLFCGAGGVCGDDLEQNFAKPPANARAWVYWYFMDGMMTREGMTADLEAMRRAGIGGAIFLEVNIGLPRGPVEFMSPQWQALFTHAVKEADRLGIEIALGAGPGWCGSGRPVGEAGTIHAASRRQPDERRRTAEIIREPAATAAAPALLWRGHADAGVEGGMGEFLPRCRRAGVSDAGRDESR